MGAEQKKQGTVLKVKPGSGRVRGGNAQGIVGKRLANAREEHKPDPRQVPGGGGHGLKKKE